MTTRNEFKDLAVTRLKEAKALFRENFYDGAIYLVGYVIEYALKARICKILDMTDYPDSGEISKSFKTHKYSDLLKLAGLEKKFDTAKKENEDLFENWSLVTNWSTDFRYTRVGTNKKEDVKEIIEALEDPEDGVFTWIRAKW